MSQENPLYFQTMFASGQYQPLSDAFITPFDFNSRPNSPDSYDLAKIGTGQGYLGNHLYTPPTSGYSTPAYHQNSMSSPNHYAEQLYPTPPSSYDDLTTLPAGWFSTAFENNFKVGQKRPTPHSSKVVKPARRAAKVHPVESPGRDTRNLRYFASTFGSPVDLYFTPDSAIGNVDHYRSRASTPGKSNETSTPDISTTPASDNSVTSASDIPITPASDIPIIPASDSSVTPVEGVWTRGKQLGCGITGTIWSKECYVDGAKQVRAVKRIGKQKQYCIESEGIRNREIESSARFSDPRYQEHFVQALSYYDCCGYLCIDFEYSLYGTLENCMLPTLQEMDAQSIAWQLLQGLQTLHATNTVHGNIRLANILIVSESPCWKVKIGDFGIVSKPTVEPFSFTSQSSETGYLAPEMLGLVNCKQAGGWDERSTAVDIWALGEVMHRALTGEQCFTKDTLRAYTRSETVFPGRSLMQKGAGFEAWDLWAKMMAPLPSRRLSASAALEHPWLRHLRL